MDDVGVLSADLWSLRRELATILDATIVRAGAGNPLRWSAVAGWTGPRGRRARRLAGLLRVPFHPVSAGPLAAVRPDREAPVSLRVGGRPSTSPPPVSEGFDLVRRLRLSYRNDRPDRLPPEWARPVSLVIAGPDGDAAVAAVERAQAEGVVAAIASEADAAPGWTDHVAGSRRGAVAADGVNPWALFDVVRRVYAADDGDLARLASLAGLPTEGGIDPMIADDLFAATFVAGVTWFDPWSREPCGFEQAAERLAWLRDRFHETRPRSVAVGISRWKASRVAQFLDGPDGPPVFVASRTAAVAEAARIGGQVVAWETRMPARLPADCAAAGVPLLRMEDGFLRSVGLGAAFLPGASAVLDGRGIYYDPREPSDLETILATATFPADLLARAAALRARVVAERLSKYNVGRPEALDAIPQGRTVVLVPGQVEDDASILLGSVRVSTNLGLLEAARARNPDAFLIFKPHPDVVAGLRRGAVEQAAARRHADLVLPDAGIADLLDRVDAVETMTSLAGFEALMRGKRVTVHGRPFYAGWGLSEDLDPPARRTRRLTLDALVAGALILYPRYLDPVTGLRCPPEILIERLAAGRDAALSASPTVEVLRRRYVRLRHAVLGPLARQLRRLRGALREPAPLRRPVAAPKPELGD